MESSSIKGDGKLPKLSFKMNLPKQSSKQLCVGDLILNIPGIATIAWEATSGYPPYQYEGSTHLKAKGPIPGCAFAQVPFYEVLTKRLFIPEVKGVEGSFYQIAPLKVTLKGTNTVRSDFGIHFDANVPGSAGCVVLRRQLDWDRFRQLMKEFAQQGLKSLALEVSYT